MIDVITIDGPAGAGKSATSNALAERLGLDLLNTGAMYRAIALKGLREGADLTNEETLVRIARGVAIEARAGRTWLDGEDVTDAVRAPEVSRAVRYPANAPGVREIMASLQRQIGLRQPLVTEGRDQGTAVFPDAACKFYLTASADERARRRRGELLARGTDEPLESIRDQILERDRLDSTREVGPLTQPEDAVVIDSDGKSIDQVVDEMERIARAKLAIFQSDAANA